MCEHPFLIAMEKEKKKKLNGLDLYVIFSISALIIFTIVTQIMLFMGLMVNDTLTTCFYAYFGGETVTCAVIKIFKIKEEQQEVIPKDDEGAVG